MTHHEPGRRVTSALVRNPEIKCTAAVSRP
ncbi:MAG: hypothetical protein QOF39_1374 [Frankiales bacterium]|jgi:hypothetical protein|nr:hypothetical protein [Frankiales bacterium]